MKISGQLLGEVVPGTCLFQGGGVTEGAAEKLIAEMEEHGGKEVTAGADSPEVARSVFGWLGRRYGENYDNIFGDKKDEE